MVRRLLEWLTARRPPDFVIGEDYMRRWFIKRTGGLDPREDDRDSNIFLHNVRHSDDDRAKHDHPWWNITVVLAGSYLEVVPDLSRAETPYMLVAAMPEKKIRRRAGSIVFRRASAAHRLVIDGQDAWTLFITGRKSREWGFHCPGGWRHWKEFTSPNDSSKVGRGCA